MNKMVNKHLYESIMKDVSKVIKQHINENNSSMNNGEDIFTYLKQLPKTNIDEQYARAVLVGVVGMLIKNNIFDDLHKYNLSVAVELPTNTSKEISIDLTSNIENAYSELLKYCTTYNKYNAPLFITVKGINFDCIKISNKFGEFTDIIPNTSDIRQNFRSPVYIDDIIVNITFTIIGDFVPALRELGKFISTYINGVIPFIKNKLQPLNKYMQTLL